MVYRLGHFISNAANQETGEQYMQEPKKMALIIRQTWLKFSVISLTDNVTNESTSESILADEKGNVKKYLIAYIYRDELRSGTNGAAELNLKNEAKKVRSRLLAGKYWTNKKANGLMDFKFRTYENKDTPETFEEMKNKWRSNEDWKELPKNWKELI